MSITNISSKTQFDELIGASTLSAVHFWAPWATQCEPMDEAMKILAEEEADLKTVQFIRVEAEEQAEISMKFEVRNIGRFECQTYQSFRWTDDEGLKPFSLKKAEINT